MLVPRQIVSPQGNRPVIGIVQDTLLGCSKFTQRGTFMTRDMVFNTLMNFEAWDGTIPIPAILKPVPLWTGKQIFSLILPRVNFERTSNAHPDNESTPLTVADTRVLVNQGELLSGIMDKRSLGTSSGSLIHVTWLELGPEATKMFINTVQKVVNFWLLHHGFSVGVADTIADATVLEVIESQIDQAKRDVSGVIQEARTGKLERQPGRTLVDSFEVRVNEVLNGATDSSGKEVQKSLKPSNNINAMVTAGSKGNNINLCQIIACVGQQNISGKRIKYGFRDRTLPHFPKGDLGAEARGFVGNSYLRGLLPHEFFFHAMGGREGVIDTAIKTAETGYIQRRLVKAMEDVMVRYDHTVRNSLGDIIQFVYGEDGLDACFIEKQKLPSVKMKAEKFHDTYRIDLSKVDELDSWMDADVKEKLLLNPGAHAALANEFHQIEEDAKLLRKDIVVKGDDQLHLPVNLKRLIWNAQWRQFRTHMDTKSDLDPLEVVAKVQQLCEKIIVVHGSDRFSKMVQENATMLFKILLRSTLSAKQVLKEYRLSKDSFRWLLGEIEARFHQAICAPGEVVGSIAAQSIGEPATQMTLNTFHYAGVSAKNATLGVPRVREIINVAANVKAPSLTVFLKPEFSKTQDAAKQVLNKMEYATLKDITLRTEIYYDPDPAHTVVEEDREFVQYYFEIPDEDFDVSKVSPWMLRLVLDRKNKEDKGLTNSEIAEMINNEFSGDLKCIFNNDNSPTLVLQVRVLDPDRAADKDMDGAQEDTNSGEDDELFLKRVEQTLLTEMPLRGIEKISKVFMRKEKYQYFDEKGVFVDKDEWMLETEGVDMMAVMSIPEVEHSRCMSNSLVETFQVLGIEGARAALVNELRGVLSFDGSYVNYRHLAMLVDVMTCRGHLMAITRHGINRKDTGPLMRCSFEETVEILYEAAAYSETDYLRGVSENIMLGQLIPVGTGCFDLVLDDESLKRHNVEPSTIGISELMGSVNDSAATPVLGTPRTSGYENTGGFSPLAGQFSPYAGGSFSPSSPTGAGAASPSYSASPTSPRYSPTSPAHSASPMRYITITLSGRTIGHGLTCVLVCLYALVLDSLLHRLRTLLHHPSIHRPPRVTSHLPVRATRPLAPAIHQLVRRTLPSPLLITQVNARRRTPARRPARVTRRRALVIHRLVRAIHPPARATLLQAPVTLLRARASKARLQAVRRTRLLAPAIHRLVRAILPLAPVTPLRVPATLLLRPHMLPVLLALSIPQPGTISV